MLMLSPCSVLVSIGAASAGIVAVRMFTAVSLARSASVGDFHVVAIVGMILSDSGPRRRVVGNQRAAECSHAAARQRPAGRVVVDRGQPIYVIGTHGNTERQEIFRGHARYVTVDIGLGLGLP